MRCPEHWADVSSTIGICASCLRERLLAYLAQQQQHVQLLLQQPPPPLFPRSVSPYVARRKSLCDDDDEDCSTNNMFFHTPQVGPSKPYANPNVQRKKRFLQFKVFRSRSDVANQDPPRSSAPWLSTMFSTRGSRFALSPARVSGAEAEPSMSPCRARNCQSPLPPSATGLGLCLSPLVWSSPQRFASNHVKHRKSGALDGGSAEVGRRNFSSAVSFCSNRSRKLSDLGKR